MFIDYFESIYGYEPFPWQSDLFTKVMENGWPETISIPTGTGKTSVMDIALLSLALGASVPRRIFLIVDRRIVVDDAYRRAKFIQTKINLATSGILLSIKNRLLKCGGEIPLEIALLRGGVYREDNWVRHPAQPVIICSTVDQAGSRLLHQGYGVSGNMRSIHAGLLAYDSLLILDEAHCSEPFRQSLAWVARYRRICDRTLEKPFVVVSMTATPRSEAKSFRLSSDDYKHPVLKKRLAAKKQLHLEVIRKGNRLEKYIIEKLKEQDIEGKTILIVVNRVLTARIIAESLLKEMENHKEPLKIEYPVVLTGRSRPVERDRLLADKMFRLSSGRDRALVSKEKALVIVATQTVEVGADIDTDILFTEICPIDSLKQRLGRLDRLGELGTTDAFCFAEEKLDTMDKGSIETDPVYGDAMFYTWHWLKTQINKKGIIDVGPASLDILIKKAITEQRKKMQTPSEDAPLVYPDYLDLWVQTSPAPYTVPEPAIFLHGPERGEPDVQIIWRADLSEDTTKWVETVSLMPPVIGESVAVPVSKARKWLLQSQKSIDSLSDTEGEKIEDEIFLQRNKRILSPFLRWQGRETSAVYTDVFYIKPGDTIVVPITIGGCDSWGWNPNVVTRDKIIDVRDVAEEAYLASGREPVLRIHPSKLENLPFEFLGIPLNQEDEIIDKITPIIEEVISSVEIDQIKDPVIREVIGIVQGLRKLNCFPHPSGIGWVVTSTRKKTDRIQGFTSEDDTASSISSMVLLKDHCEHVSEEMEKTAKSLKLPTNLSKDMVLAARYHDIGKADPRFQTLLCGGNRIRAYKTGLLAKSPYLPMDHIHYLALRKKSGYPHGARHELLSLRLLESNSELLSKIHDKELVLHLISSHHGRGRAFVPSFNDPEALSVKFSMDGFNFHSISDCKVEGKPLEHASSGIPDRFWSLIKRYGWWGLSYLEACFRLADHRASERENKGGSV